MIRSTTRAAIRFVTVLIAAGNLTIGTGVTALAEPNAAPSQFVTAGEMRGDRVHLSSSAVRTASAHGWWTYPDPTELKAKVTVQLQAKVQGTWVDVGPPGEKVVRPGTGGSATRANARFVCVTFVSTEWRSVIDVDILGKLDAPNKLYTEVQRLDCGV